LCLSGVIIKLSHTPQKHTNYGNNNKHQQSNAGSTRRLVYSRWWCRGWR
jgi:hypothetical protein